MGVLSTLGILKDDPEQDARDAAEKEAKEAAKAAKRKPGKVPPPISSFAVSQQTVNNMSGVPDDKFVEMLWKVISDNNIPGQDYFEFKAAVDSMAALPIDEKSKFITTFTIFKGQGCSKEVLISSIDKYTSLIKNEHSIFATDFEDQHNQKVTGKLQQIEATKKKVEELNKQIMEANNFILTASQEAQQEEMQLQMTAANFNKSAEKVLGLLQGDKDKINMYIQ